MESKTGLDYCRALDKIVGYIKVGISKLNVSVAFELKRTHLKLQTIMNTVVQSDRQLLAGRD